MKLNVGGIDRALRIVLGGILVILAGAGVVGWWGWMGVVPFVTGVFGFCPVYRLLGMNTCRLRGPTS